MDADKDVYCICRTSMSADDTFMIQCDFCKEWFHGECIGMTKNESEQIDMFCCVKCENKNPRMTTTYKTKCMKKRKVKKTRHGMTTKRHTTTPGLASNLQVRKQNETTVNKSSPESDCLKLSAASTSKELKPKSQEFGFVDTTVRKAKTDAYERLKKNVSNVPVAKDNFHVLSKTENTPLRQCYGPGCTKANSKGSKYCSDACGKALARNRILEILPERLEQYLLIPSTADELSRRKLNDIRAQLLDIEKRLESVEIKINRLIIQVRQWKHPGNVFVEEPCEDATFVVDCLLCGMEIQNKTFERHLEQCFRRSESKIFITESTDRPSDFHWNVFCNQKIGHKLYCKKLRVLCPQHYKSNRKEDEVCGYKIGVSNGVSRHCGNKSRTCNHMNWEDRLRAELDQEKVNLLVKYNKLMKEEAKIKTEMSSRSNVLGLMMHQTIVH